MSRPSLTNRRKMLAFGDAAVASPPVAGTASALGSHRQAATTRRPMHRPSGSPANFPDVPVPRACGLQPLTPPDLIRTSEKRS
jgi:hypothetical protein